MTSRRGRAQSGRGAAVLFGWLSIFVTAPVFGQTFVPPAREVPQLGEGVDAQVSLPSTLAGVHAYLEGRTGGELRREFRELLGAHPQSAMDALILRAGTRVPPAVPAARASLRQSAREDALALLALEMERSPEARARWMERLRALLESGPARTPSGSSRPNGEFVGGTMVDEDLRCAAIGTVGGLRAFELAPRVAAHLDDELPRVRHAASAGLFALYRLRFTSREAFDAEWPRLESLRVDPPFLRELESEQQRARALALRLIALSPEGVAAWLEDPDPVVRSRAAEALTRFVGEGKVGVPDAIDALLGRLAEEVDADAFHALLHNLTDLLGGSPPGSNSVVRLREVLDGVIERRQRDLAGPILRALSRMPWDPDPASGEQSVESGVRRVVGLFGRVVDRGRPLDPDHILMGIDAIESLCVREDPSPEWRALTQPARSGLAFLLGEYGGSEEVRIEAAGAYSSLLADDVERMLQLLADGRTFVGLRYELLGALGRILPEAELDETRSSAILETLVGLADAGETGVRRRALEVLTSDVFEPRVASAGTRAGAEALVERLEYETDPELRSLLLQLIGSFEQPALVERLLLSSFFDTWTQGGPRNISEMATALGQLAGGDPAVVLRAAQRLLVNLVGERQVDSELVRLESAMTLVTSLSLESAQALRPPAHGRIVGWALDLREKGGARLAGTPGGADVLERLVEVHLPGAQDVLERPERGWALLSGDFHVARPAGISLQDVQRRYREAAAHLDATTPEYGRLIRDEARFLMRVDRAERALEAYSTLRGLGTSLAADRADPTRGAADGSGGESSLFELSDLRDFASLTAARSGSAEGTERELRAAARDAVAIGLELVRRGTWRAEPGSQRLQDLRDLVRRTQRSQSPQQLAQVSAYFADLPDAPPMGPLPTEEYRNAPSGLPGESSEVAPLWDGLLGREEWHRSLRVLRDDLLGELVLESDPEEDEGDAAVEETAERAGSSPESPGPAAGSGSLRYR